MKELKLLAVIRDAALLELGLLLQTMAEEIQKRTLFVTTGDNGIRPVDITWFGLGPWT